MLEVLWGKKFNQSSIQNAQITSAVGEEGRLTFRNAVAVLAVLFCLHSHNSFAVTDDTIPFNIPQQRADRALTQFAEQANLTLVFPFEQLKDKTANRLVGDYPIATAANLLLRNTGLTPAFSDQLVLTIASEPKGKSMNTTNSSKRKTVLAGLVGLFAAGGMTQAVAQGGEAATGQSAIDEIIVTANKREQSLQDTAMSISALDGDTINKRNLAGMGDYLSSIPGVSILDQGPGFNSLVIRGLSAKPQGEAFNSSPISGVYFGETSISGLGLDGNTADIKLVDMERIEVLRGPQGTLYGAGAMGGVVRNVPVDPNLEQFEGSLQFGYSNTAEEGSDNNVAKGVINIPLIPDVLAMRAVAYRFDNGGYYKNIAASDSTLSAAAIAFGATVLDSDDIGGDETVGGRLSLLWQPSDQLAINLNYLSQNTEQNGWASTDLDLEGEWSQRRYRVWDSANNSPAFSESDLDEGFEDDIELTNLTVEYDLDWGTIFSSTSWVDEKTNRQREIAAFFAPSFLPWSQLGGFSRDLFAEEIRLVSELQGPIQFIVGFYYEEMKSKQIAQDVFGGDPALNTFAPGGVVFFDLIRDRVVEQKAVFGEFSYDISEQLKLTVGGRAFSYDREVSEEQFPALFSPASFSELKSDESDISLKAGLEYKSNDSSLLYATWSEGFRLGYPVAANLNPACDTDADGFYDGSDGVSTGPRDVDSDFVENFELGGKFSLLDNQVTLNTAVYQIDWEGIPVTRLFDFCSATLNAGAARSRGVELDLSYRVNDDLLINFSSSYVNAELTEDALDLGAVSGDRLPGSPKYNASLGTEYSFRVGNYDAYWRADYAYVGGFYNNLKESGTEIADYGKLNVKVGMTVNQFDIDIFADNLTNENSLTWIDAEGFPSERGNRLRPRTLGLKFGYQF